MVPSRFRPSVHSKASQGLQRFRGKGPLLKADPAQQLVFRDYFLPVFPFIVRSSPYFPSPGPPGSRPGPRRNVEEGNPHLSVFRPSAVHSRKVHPVEL